MIGKTFWQDASKGGAVLGLVNLAEIAIAIFLPGSASIVGIVSLVATIYLMIYFTRQRVPLYGHYGFSFAQCMDFILAMGIFAGVVQGVGQAVMANWVLYEYYNELYVISQQQTMELYGGMIPAEQLAQMGEITRMMFFSPIFVVISNIYSNVLGKGFLGLFASFAIKRNPDIFYNGNDNTTNNE